MRFATHEDLSHGGGSLQPWPQYEQGEQIFAFQGEQGGSLSASEADSEPQTTHGVLDAAPAYQSLHEVSIDYISHTMLNNPS